MVDNDAESDDGLQKISRKPKKTGGFQALGLDFHVLKGILRRGYKIPTPIQRKAIPLILSGKDVVAMARTGSGKTAAFLVPMLQKLKRRTAKAGARALLIAPTRELALQTYKFTKELGKYTDLKISVLVGGDNMEEQFAAIHENPDVIIATPGRLVHVAVEMNLKMSSVEYVVFDEADRLFEMGFEEQLRETMARLPENRQTLLFSATLPKTLVDFVKAGLSDPTLVRLDVDAKISDKLTMSFYVCRFEDKLAALVYVLRHIIVSDCEQTIVFCATKHHVEYVYELLSRLSFNCTYLYSSLDPTARKLNVDKFRAKKVNILLVTDLAARGVDIPLLDNVINLHFTPKAKIFVHRVGRVARAGRHGRAFSIISAEEMPYVVDLFLFLGRSMNLLRETENEKPDTNSTSQQDSCVGLFPRTLLEIEQEIITNAHDGNVDLTVFELNMSNKHDCWIAMKNKRKAHERFVNNHEENGSSSKNDNHQLVRPTSSVHNVASADESEVKNVFRQIIQTKFRDNKDSNSILKKNKAKKAKTASSCTSKDAEYFLPYQPKDFHQEQGLSLEKTGGFDNDLNAAVVDFTADETGDMHKQKNQMKWDRKRKKFTREDNTGKNKKIKTESGVWIPASYKSDLYAKWLKKSKAGHRRDDDEDDEDNDGAPSRSAHKSFYYNLLGDS